MPEVQFNDAQIEILNAHLEEFWGANFLQWGRVLDNTWDEVREILRGHWVRHWLYNHSGNKEPGNKVSRHGKYLSLNQVLNLVKKEVEKRMWDLYGVKPRHEEELAELKEKCEKWYIDGPSEEVRQKAAEIKGRKVVKDFQMWSRDLGMLSFVLTAHRDTNGTICVSFHEQNDKAGFELFSKVQPNWQNIKIWEAWGKYAQTDIDGSVPKESLPSKQKEKIKLPLNDNGYPILVDEYLSSPATFSDLQAIISLHLVANKGKGKEKAVMKRVLPKAGMVVPRSKSTDKEQEEKEGFDEIISDDEHGANVQNQLQGVEEVDKDSPRHASITYKSQRRFLARLCTGKEYLKLVDAVYQLPKDKPGHSSQSNGQPEDYLDYWLLWVSWGYVHSMIPLEIHQGMLLRDLHTIQIADEDNDLTWSYIEFAMVGKTILQFRRDMAKAI
ncbi:hypothetical protein SERLADRAFT_412201 [Serpula lacrymans var. lacrymans S7.9]|uniref:Uncharacterized protein n=1 Tax=Serpula lacrymans var. lacrymans (strain S7.9) TaxID=578457 RepID=F8PEF2_SERL9|nr:uncharacterized protein SERLADRAFT_412201 [Serpula lacrymans var. lacrymans S7.9]EGO18484.1 hypothetical protein SERLADRAFT_412201 [Serpula lacrymans var. lacrymans S7.9]